MLNSNILKKRIIIISNYVILIIFSIIMLIPLIWMISTSLKPMSDVISPVPKWIPSRLVFSNFSDAWRFIPFGRYYINTIIIVTLTLIVQLITSSLAAFAFARFKFKGQSTLFILFLIQLMLTAQSTVVPNYLTISKLGLLDTYFAVAAPYFASAFGIFLLRQAFLTIPKELEDAARIDGCEGLCFLRRVALPVVKPTILAFSIISISYHWNEFFWPLMVTDTVRARTLTIGLGIFAESAEGGNQWALLMAATLIVIIPVIALFLIFQKHFMRSFMRSGIKG